MRFWRLGFFATVRVGIHPENGWKMLILAGLLGIFMTVGHAGESDRKALKIGYFTDSFIPDAPEGETRTQFEPWVRELVKKTISGNADAKLESYTDFISTMMTSKGSAYDVFPMYAYDFVRLRQFCNLDAILVPSWQGSPLTEYSIYVPQHSRITKPEDLVQKKVLFEIAGRGELPYFWFDNYVRKHTGQSFKKTITTKSVSSAMLAALPVFFEEDGFEACVLSNVGFQDILAGNKQVGKFLRPIAHAPKLLTHVIACRRDLSEEVRQNVIKTSLSMISSSALGTVQSIQFSPFKPELIENLEHEWLAYHTNLLSEPHAEPNIETEEARPKNLIEARAAAAFPAAKNGSSAAALPSPFRVPGGRIITPVSPR